MVRGTSWYHDQRLVTMSGVRAEREVSAASHISATILVKFSKPTAETTPSVVRLLA